MIISNKCNLCVIFKEITGILGEGDQELINVCASITDLATSSNTMLSSTKTKQDNCNVYYITVIIMIICFDISLHECFVEVR